MSASLTERAVIVHTRCGSPDVHLGAWIHANTHAIVSTGADSPSGSSYAWCVACDAAGRDGRAEGELSEVSATDSRR